MKTNEIDNIKLYTDLLKVAYNQETEKTGLVCGVIAGTLRDEIYKACVDVVENFDFNNVDGVNYGGAKL